MRCGSLIIAEAIVLAIAVGDEFHNADDDQGPDDYGPEH
jgi:hypothetical protein